MKRSPLLLFLLVAASLLSVAADYEVIADKAARFFRHREWASASAMYELMLEQAPDVDWGVILEQAYLEMIPVNSFWNEGEILFYDQEFTKENCPANYVMFRALKDIYHLSPEINVMLPLDAMKERYGLTATWEYFAQEEERFQTELRRRNVYSGFFQWLRYLFDVVAKNRRMLEKGEGEREYFNLFSELDSRRIILFGAGKIMEYYLYKYGKLIQIVKYHHIEHSPSI